jgi:Zn-dependent membrane protease YugP
MKIKETFIVWSNNHNQYVKLHNALNMNGYKSEWFIENNNELYPIPLDTAMDLLKDH